MSELPARRRVRDVQVMRALAHPLRTSLLNYLLAVGPRTASECATAVGSTPSNCSWHLRQLAEYGLVERAEAGDGRERPWRAAVVGLDFGELAPDPAYRTVQVAAASARLAEDQLLAQRFFDSVDRLDERWREASALNSYSLRVTPEELTGLLERLDGLLRPYVTTVREDAPGEARPVHVSLGAFPRVEADGKPST
ncbi:helix-turn-helix domain-containing protein [Amycolatopsis suaedae]|uniref:ArsR family transcriptional regulator n=1 Tax=Amycolatopsis suaedae TaxID=2510978 RepID=A0A4V2EM36_9PSEU|nr:helix-turn-helix domain-containing protein [Amycolatopsis suaedae]RZQ63695.1 ArsR family transcriptional regulator [Amycolatopsis suaedae]